MIKDMRHINERLLDIEKVIFLMRDTMSFKEDSPEILHLLTLDVGILTELILRLNDELNS